jgi:hypothetical protein
MGFLARLWRRVESRPGEPRVDEDGFLHAADLTPDDVGKLERRGWSGELPDHGLHGKPPKGWMRLLVAGFGAIPALRAGEDGASEDATGADAVVRDWSSGGDWSGAGGDWGSATRRVGSRLGNR